MNGSSPCDACVYTMCANRPICLSMAQIYGPPLHHGHILRLRRRGVGSRKGCPPAHRWSFHPGLIRASTGGDRWPVEQSRAGTVTVLPLHLTTINPRRACACLRQEGIRAFKKSKKPKLPPGTARYSSWPEVAIWRWRLTPPIALRTP